MLINVCLPIDLSASDPAANNLAQMIDTRINSPEAFSNINSTFTFRALTGLRTRSVSYDHRVYRGMGKVTL